MTIDPLHGKSNEDVRNVIGISKLISQGENDVRIGKLKSQEEVFSDIARSLEAKMK